MRGNYEIPIRIRVTKKMHNRFTERASEKDMSKSEHLRDLIKKDNK